MRGEEWRMKRENWNSLKGLKDRSVSAWGEIAGKNRESTMRGLKHRSVIEGKCVLKQGFKFLI
ncbi:hypothetical protein [Cecembia calidifontis]|jgi:hypothetical protein|uniref:Uncharacterized protein n=1 Tax=Cecembia calidifontis TaxID=1187080 RepID=A0A4V2F625_9BACT|nr:hypothetical protein [Cecembia calidifontis]RZS94839.1 hypothetical protein BC751_0349 [Cecembia calidifontis]